MSRYVAFLRAINVGGHVVKMTQLTALFEALGLRDVETFIASGNVIFTAAGKAPALEKRVERHLRQSLGYDIRTFVRTVDEVAEVAAYQPFSRRELEQATALDVGFLAEPLHAEGLAALMSLRTSVDDFHVRGRELFWKRLVSQADSKFSNAAFERAVGRSVTFRGINTIARLAAKYPPSAAAAAAAAAAGTRRAGRPPKRRA